MKSKIYLVVLESDKTSVTTASFNQFKAHDLCHLAKRLSGISHSVVTENLDSVLSHDLFSQLFKKSPRFENEFKKLFPSTFKLFFS